VIWSAEPVVIARRVGRDSTADPSGHGFLFQYTTEFALGVEAFLA
jgi:hypothetical protein